LDATEISSGGDYSCALLSGGPVECWGHNHYGQLGDGTYYDALTPVSVSGLSVATQVSAGQWNACALLSDHTVKCWGYNAYGQLGNGTTTNSPTPISVIGLP
jgi:alpha-tubulin suppressor-like RCC1 family protein